MLMKQEDIVKRLSVVPIFKELSADELEPIIKIAHTRFYKQKMYVFMQEGLVGGRYRLTTQFTNRELANMIGTSRETVSRTINHVKKKDYIVLDEDGYYLIDQGALQQELFY
jgi:Fic family protein